MDDIKENQQLQSFPEEEQILLTAYSKKFKEQLAPKVTFGKDRQVTPDAVTTAKMAEALGTTDPKLTSKLLSQVVGLCASADSEEDQCNVALSILYGIKPRDELEAMLAVQMVGVHNMAMEFTARAMISDQTFVGVNQNVERATKMFRTFTAQMEALNRYRGRGQQKVIVEHVNVHAGGQAIVGNVASQGEGGNGSN